MEIKCYVRNFILKIYKTRHEDIQLYFLILADAVHRFVNDYWKEILDEFGSQIIKKLVNKTARQIGKLFAVIPAEDMMLP